MKADWVSVDVWPCNKTYPDVYSCSFTLIWHPFLMTGCLCVVCSETGHAFLLTLKRWARYAKHICDPSKNLSPFHWQKNSFSQIAKRNFILPLLPPGSCPQPPKWDRRCIYCSSTSPCSPTLLDAIRVASFIHSFCDWIPVLAPNLSIHPSLIPSYTFLCNQALHLEFHTAHLNSCIFGLFTYLCTLILNITYSFCYSKHINASTVS